MLPYLVRMASHAPLQTTGIVLTALLGLLGACAFDFDSAFSEPPAGQDAGADVALDQAYDGMLDAGHGEAGGSGTGGAGGSGTGGAGGNSDTEECFNGIDDDGDGVVDCTDSDCSALARCAVLPDGFEAFASLRLGEEAAGPCGDGFDASVEGGLAPVLPAASCSACGCHAPTGQICAEPFNIREWEQDACTSGFFGTWHLYGGQKCGWINIDPATHVAAEVRMATGGSCTAVVAVADGAPASFGIEARICKSQGRANCETPGAACIPVAATCVIANGDRVCPTEYAEKTVVFTGGFADDRDCEECSCGAPSAVPCVVTTDFHHDNKCTDLDFTWVHDSSCAPSFMNAPRYYKVRSAVPDQESSCAPVGGAPTGSVTPLGPVTVCCS